MLTAPTPILIVDVAEALEQITIFNCPSYKPLAIVNSEFAVLLIYVVVVVALMAPEFARDCGEPPNTTVPVNFANVAGKLASKVEMDIFLSLLLCTRYRTSAELTDVAVVKSVILLSAMIHYGVTVNVAALEVAVTPVLVPVTTQRYLYVSNPVTSEMFNVSVVAVL